MTNTMTYPPEALESTRVDVDLLQPGKVLHDPIYDDTGVLLLASGVVVTDRFKEALLARNVTGVILSVTDAAEMRLDDLRHSLGPDGSVFDSSHVERLDEIIDSGNLFLAGSGTAVKDRVVLSGCRAYHPKVRAEILEAHREASRELDSMLKRALHGEPVDVQQLSTFVGTYTSAFSADPDCVMAVALQLSQDSTLADLSLKTTVLSLALGIEMGFDDLSLRDLGLTAFLHDWGMIRVPESIRHSLEPLTPIDFMQIRKHPTYTLEILDRIQGIPKVVVLASYQHHERPNGKGYPRGLHRAHIHPFARILNVSDTYVALTSRRPHRPPLMPYSGMECLIRQASGGDADPDVVRALLRVQSLFPIGSFVLLSDGSLAQVLRRSSSNYAAPVVRVLADPEGIRLPPEDDSAIVNLEEDERKIKQALPSPQSGQISSRHEETLRYVRQRIC